MKSVIAVALVASASAFVPAQNARMPTKLNFEYGEYDDKLWDHDAKKEVYTKWDPASPRGSRNFNPFETFKGNSPDASGIYPGEVSDISDVMAFPWIFIPLDLYYVILLLYFVETILTQYSSLFLSCQARYKDPKRGDVSYAIMMLEKADIDDMTANPKAGSEPGCAGCKS